MTQDKQTLGAWREACRQGDTQALGALLEQHPALLDDHQGIMRATAEGQVEAVRFLLSRGAQPDNYGSRGLRRPLHQCLSPSQPRQPAHVEIARLLLEAGADLEAPGQFQKMPPLQVAAASGYLPLVELLRQAGARVDTHAAAITCDTQRLAALLAESPARASRRDEQGRTPLHSLAMSRLWSWDAAQQARTLEAARLLLEAGADLNAPQERDCKYQGTPLWWAISSGRCPALVRLLLERGADTEGGLLAAAYQGSGELLAALLEAGAGVDAVDARGYTALQHVLLFKRPEAAPTLLEAGADPARVTERGHTALHLAALCGHSPELLGLLVEAGAPLGARDQEGRTARELALERGHAEAAAWLGEASGAASRA